MFMETTVKQRLIKYLNYKDITQREFADIVGLSSGYVNAIRKGILPETLHKIAIHFPDLNTGWIITGEGEMLKQIQQEQAPGQPHSEEYWKELVASQQRTIESQSRIIEQQSRSIQSFLARAGSTEAV